MNSDRVAMACAERRAAGQDGQQGLCIVNLQRTPYDEQCTVRIWGVLDDVIGLLAKELDLHVPMKAVKMRGEQWTQNHPRLTYNTPTRSARDPL